MTVTATLGGKPAHASAAYEFLYAGATLVGTRYPRSNPHFTFTGHFSDFLVFPPDAVGEPLTLQIVIKDGAHTVNLDWQINTVK